MGKVKLIGVIIILSLSFCNYSFAYERVIKNQSDKTWVIVNVPFALKNYSIFDSNANVPKACSPRKDRLTNVCVLSPGETTYITYKYAGELLFVDQKQNLTVTYNIARHPEEFWVPKNSRINVSNGDITIYDKNDVG